MPFQIGETIGSYRLVEQLGQGGMASVYKAYHPALDRFVAIKVLHLALNDDPNFIARFRREAKVVARLDHPNIVPVYDFAEYDGQPYLVMKMIEGETLKARLQGEHLTYPEILAIVEAVGLALSYAHHMNVLHRDIKPSNVLLARDKQIFLADFGLARIMDSESSLTADRLEGTPQYISPEQALSSGDLDVRTDVYSFGVMLYEMVVGRVPFKGDSPLATIHEHIYTLPPAPRSVNPQVSEGMEKVLLKALAKNRDERYSDIASLVSAFRAALTGQPQGSVIIQASPDEELVFTPSENPNLAPPPVIPVQPAPINAPANPAPSSADKPRQVATVSFPDLQEPSATSQASDAALPETVRKGFPKFLLVIGGVLLVLLILAAGGLVLRGFQQQKQKQTNTSTLQPVQTVTVDVTGIVRKDLEGAITALAGHDLLAVALQLDRVHQDIGDDAAQFNNALQYLQNQNDWLLAAIFVYTSDRPKLVEGIAAQPERVHEILYRAAGDPQAGEFLKRNTDKPLFVVANIRFELLYGNPDQARSDLVKLQANRTQLARFPEARLLQVEFEQKTNDLTKARQDLASLLNEINLPDWVRRMALELDQKIPH